MNYRSTLRYKIYKYDASTDQWTNDIDLYGDHVSYQSNDDTVPAE